MDKHQDTQTSFVPPRHWVGVEELDAGYWADSQVREKRGQEFFEKPVEQIAAIDASDKAGLARRDFLTVMGASMAMASFACARRPVHKIIPYVVKPEEIIPGVPTWYASTSKDCTSGCGILVKDREGRPIKLEGNPDHPLNRGALCAVCQASLLNLYDPDRVKSAVARSRSDGSRREISWQDADATVVSKLKAAASAGGKVRVLSGHVISPTTLKLLQEFVGGFSGGAHVEYEPLGLEDIAEAQSQSYGAAVVPRYRFDLAETVLSLGADFLTTWVSPVEHRTDWAKNRRPDAKNAANAKLSKVYVFESTMTTTGASADERFPVRPGDELKVALAVAHELVVVQKRSAHASDAALATVLSGYKPETVAEEIGLTNGAAKIREIAHELWAARGKGLVVGGGLAARTKDAVALQIAVNLLNSVLENEGATVDGTAGYRPYRGGFAAMAKLIDDMKSGRVDVLIVYRSNPAFTLPNSVAGFEDAVKKVPFVVVINDREDETGQLADFVLPDHHYLENWGDAIPRKGVYSLQQPALHPIHSTRAFEDSLITWIKGAGLKTGLADRADDWHAYLQANWRENILREVGMTGAFQQAWEEALRKGAVSTKEAHGTARAFRAPAVASLPKYAAAQGSGATLALYPKIGMLDGRHANNPWLQELPDPITSGTWDNYLNVAPATAARLGVKNDDVVEVKVGETRVELPVYVQPGMHPGVVSAAIGYGRRAAGKVGDEAGVDVFPLLVAENGRLAFSGQQATLRKTGRVYMVATTQWHTVTENRPIINDITLAEFRKNPGAANHTDPHLREEIQSMWGEHTYPGYRWGMAIDLNTCTGCNACVIACQVENNVPVVGRQRVRTSRQMHWLRLDRYYAGGTENPDVVFQPMLCQHCENAPCETVCPVLATVHDNEGTSNQVYNRCVGTRYCQNNCPYKVRRFNFFDHWKSYEGTMNLVWNPDVTVRTRGIMEKCSFCIQRIAAGKDKAKDAGEKVQDGQIKTACQQTCPTDAIVFGNINDPASRVSQLRGDARAFRVLEGLNTKPSISYLTRVRNKEESAAHHGE